MQKSRQNRPASLLNLEVIQNERISHFLLFHKSAVIEVVE